jgi:large subunit ribosomal protein L25
MIMSSVAQTASMPALSAASRTVGGKSAVRRLRADGKVPAVAYGKTLAALPLSVNPKEVLSILKSEHGKNSVIKLSATDASTSDLVVMIKDYSYHPITRSLEHVDFVQVKLDEPVDVEIPVIMTGKAAGVTQGGILRQVYRLLPVRSLPGSIPTKIEVDVTELKLNDHISAKDVKLPEGVSVRLAPEQTVISVVAPEKDREEAAAPGAPAAAAPAAKGAAPAKDAKAAAAPAKDAKKK